MAFVSQGPLFGIDPHNTNTVHVGAWYGFFVCFFSLPIFRRQICFYLYFLVPGSSHSLFLKVFAGSAYLSQTDTWPRDRKPVRPLDSGSTHGRRQECSGSNSLPLVQWPGEPQTGVLALGFPGGPVDKNQPAKAKDMSLIPGPERSHMPHRATEPVCHNYWSPCAESLCSAAREPQQWGAGALQLKSSPHSPQPEKACGQQGRLSTAKNK